MSAFEKLKQEGAIQRGRKAKSTGNQPKEKKYYLRAEARRRAGLVLQHRYRDEFEALVEAEMLAMQDVSKVTE